MIEKITTTLNMLGLYDIYKETIRDKSGRPTKTAGLILSRGSDSKCSNSQPNILQVFDLFTGKVHSENVALNKIREVDFLSEARVIPMEAHNPGMILTLADVFGAEPFILLDGNADEENYIRVIDDHRYNALRARDKKLVLLESLQDVRIHPFVLRSATFTEFKREHPSFDPEHPMSRIPKSMDHLKEMLANLLQNPKTALDVLSVKADLSIVADHLDAAEGMLEGVSSDVKIRSGGELKKNEATTDTDLTLTTVIIRGTGKMCVVKADTTTDAKEKLGKIFTSAHCDAHMTHDNEVEHYLKNDGVIKGIDSINSPNDLILVDLPEEETAEENDNSA